MIVTEKPQYLNQKERKSSHLPPFNLPLQPVPTSSGKAMKALIIIGFILSLGALIATVLLTGSLSLERKERAALEASKIQLQDKVESLQGENAQYRSQIEQLREQVRSYTAENAKVRKELDRRSDELVATNSRVATMEQEKNELLQEIERLRSGFTEELPSVTVIAPSEQAATAPVESSLEAPLPAESSEISAPSEAPAETASENFQIMTVNRKFNFVVINLGMKNDLKMGDKLNVIRDGKTIGEIQVEKLYDRFAAAAILNEARKSKIEKGDFVDLG